MGLATGETLAYTSGMESVGDQLRRIVLNAPITRAELARETGIPESTLSKFVNGKLGLSSRNLDRIGEALGLVVKSTRRKLKR